MNPTTIEAMSFIPVEPQVTPPAQVKAAEIVAAVNRATKGAVSALILPWEALWESAESTPQEIFNALGAQGAMVLLAGSIAVEHITKIAEGLSLVTGQTVTPEGPELLGHAKYLTTKYPVTVDPLTGHVTVTMPPEEE